MIEDATLAAGLKYIKSKATRIDVCTHRPKTAAEARARSVGYTTTFKVEDPEACEGGMCCCIDDIAPGTTTKDATPYFWAISGDGELLATGKLTNTQRLVPGIAFTLPKIECELTRGDH